MPKSRQGFLVGIYYATSITLFFKISYDILSVVLFFKQITLGGGTMTVEELTSKFSMFTFAKDADCWLESINPSNQKSKNLTIQFKERRIVQIKTLKILCAGGISFTEDGDFVVVFNDFKNRDFKDDAMTLGHEIGHTFGFDLSRTPPKELVDHKSMDFSYYDKNGCWDGCFLEDFCDAFAEQWVIRNGCDFVATALKNQYSTIMGYDVFLQGEK